MSTFRVEVVPVVLEKHPNADTLSIAKVKGWQCVVRTTDFANTVLGAYIPLEAQLPEFPEWEFLRPRKFRVKTLKLRGVLSQGLLIPARPEWKVGEDVTEQLQAKKYEPWVPVKFGGDTIAEPDGFFRYTDIENWKNYPEVIQSGEEVMITEKIHGTSCRAGLIQEQYIVGSHRTAQALTSQSIYMQVTQALQLEERLRELQRASFPNQNIILYGEIYGKGVQNLQYGLSKPTLALFDISVNGRYLNAEEFAKYVDLLDLQKVPVLKIGPWHPEDLQLADGQTTIGGATHIREGIVVKPVKERWHASVGRVVLKRLSDKYLLKDFAEEGPGH